MSDATPDTDPQPTTPAVTPPADPDRLGDAGKRALEAERDARKAAEKAARETQAELNRLRTEAQQRADAEAAEQGKWKELAEKREADLTDTATKLTTAEAELEALRAYVKTDVDAVAKAVKDAKDSTVAKALLIAHPGDEASATALLDWATKAKPFLAELDAKPAPPRGAGPDPKPTGGQRVNEREEINRVRSSISL